MAKENKINMSYFLSYTKFFMLLKSSYLTSHNPKRKYVHTLIIGFS